MNQPSIGIAAAAMECGVSAPTLRAWEKRYRFPTPLRATNGERLYSADQVSKLVLIRRLIERGHRASKIVLLDRDELQRLLDSIERKLPEASVSLDFQKCLQGLSAKSIGDLRRLLQSALVRQGLSRFVLDTVRPLIQMVGEWWVGGKIEVFQEHLFVEQLERLLQEAMAPLESAGAPTIILTTLTSEQHRLGLLMLEALLRLEGATCIPLGVQMPTSEIVKLTAASKADIVALTFSASYRDPQGRKLLLGLRRDLAAHIEIWAGGTQAASIARAISGVAVFRGLEDGVAAYRDWRARA